MSEYTDITDEQAARYLKQRGAECPVCHYPHIQGGSFDHDTGTLYQEMHCPECDASWTDAYELDRILETNVEFGEVA